jgi:hypothetical protein
MSVMLVEGATYNTGAIELEPATKSAGRHGIVNLGDDAHDWKMSITRNRPNSSNFFSSSETELTGQIVTSRRTNTGFTQRKNNK